MFSSEIDSARNPLSARWGTVLLASSVLIAVVAALVSARTTPGGWAIICIAIVAGAWTRLMWLQALDLKSALAISFIAFFCFAGLSAFWAENPLASARAATFGLFTALATRVAIQGVGHLNRPLLLHMAEGLWLGFFVALCYFFIELLSAQALKIALYNAIGLGPGDIKPVKYFQWNADGTLKAISINDLTRNTTPITLVMWSAMFAAQGALRAPYGRIVAGAIFALSVVCVVMSPHETSKLALAVGVLAFVVATFWRRLCALGTTTLWVGACLLMLPTALLLHDLKLHEPESGLQNSARARIIIWNVTAEQTLKSPYVGVGARMTYEIGPRFLEENPPKETEWFPSNKLSRHAHNVYLQTWFELGAIGILLLAACGVAIVRVIMRLPADSQPYALAVFACATVIAGSSYGMWQAWFVSLFGLAPILFAIANAVRTGGPARAS